MSTAVAGKRRDVKVSARKTDVAKGGETVVTIVFNFAKDLGLFHRKSLEESEALHKGYMKLGDEDKRGVRLEFMCGFISGVLGTDRDAAETIINGRVRLGAQATLTKPERTKDQQKAYDAARKQFSYHISRDDSRIQSKESKPEQRKRIRLSSEFKEAVTRLISTFYEEVDVTSVGEMIKLLQEFKKRIAAGDGKKAAAVVKKARNGRETEEVS